MDIHIFYWHFIQIMYIKVLNFYRGVEVRKEVFYLTMHSTHFINGYMALDMW